MATALIPRSVVCRLSTRRVDHNPLRSFPYPFHMPSEIARFVTSSFSREKFEPSIFLRFWQQLSFCDRWYAAPASAQEGPMASRCIPFQIPFTCRAKLQHLRQEVINYVLPLARGAADSSSGAISPSSSDHASVWLFWTVQPSHSLTHRPLLASP